MNKQDAIKRAAELAYEEDAFHVVGKNSSNEWVIRHIEDPESDQLSDSVKVGSDGVQPE